MFKWLLLHGTVYFLKLEVQNFLPLKFVCSLIRAVAAEIALVNQVVWEMIKNHHIRMCLCARTEQLTGFLPVGSELSSNACFIRLKASPKIGRT